MIKKDLIYQYMRTPILPVVLFMNGSVFYFGITYYTGFIPNSFRTGGFYFVTFLWASILYLRNGNYAHLRITLYDSIFLIFNIIVFVSLIWNKESTSFSLLIKFIVFVILSYILGRLCRQKEILPLVGTIFVTGFIGISCAIVDSILHPNIVFAWVRPFFFELGHTTHLVSLLIGQMIIILAIYSFCIKHLQINFQCCLTYISILILNAVLTFLMCRGIIISTLCVGLLIVVNPYSTSWKKRVMLLFSLLASLAIAFPLLPRGQSHLLNDLNVLPDQVICDENLSILAKNQSNTPLRQIASSDQYKNNSAAVRIILLRQACNLYLQHPVIGVGAGNFGVYFGKKGVHPHNTTLQVLAEFGSFGMLFILFYILIFIRFGMMVWKSRKSGKNALIISLVSALWIMHLLIIHISGDYYNNIAFVLFSGLAVTTISNIEDKEEFC